MSRKMLIAALALALLALAGALPARADRSCSFVCGPDVWCGTKCLYAGQLITCLNYGPCSPTPFAAGAATAAAPSLPAFLAAPAPSITPAGVHRSTLTGGASLGAAVTP